MNNTPSPAMGNTMQKKSVNVWMILAIIFILISIGLGIYGYVTIRNMNNKINNLNSQVADLQNKKKTLEDAVAAAATAAAKTVSNPSDNVAVATLAKNQTEATVGIIVGKNVTLGNPELSQDKNFAKVGTASLINGKPEAGGAVMYFKKVNGSWVYLDTIQNETTEFTSKYGIPANF